MPNTFHFLFFPVEFEQKRGNCWTPTHVNSNQVASLYSQMCDDDSAWRFFQQQLPGKMQVIERIIGHKCISLSQQAAISWSTLLMWAQNIPGLWVKNGQLAKFLFAFTFPLKASLQKKHEKIWANKQIPPFICLVLLAAMSGLLNEPCFAVTDISPHTTLEL